MPTSARTYAICSSLRYVKRRLLVSNAVLIYGQIYHTLLYSTIGVSRLANGGRVPPAHIERSRVARNARDYLDGTLLIISPHDPKDRGYDDKEAYLGATMWDSGGPRIFYPLIPQVSLATSHSRHECMHVLCGRSALEAALEAGMTSVTRMTAKSFAVFRTRT